MKVQGDEKKQTKYLDEFLVYPPFEAFNNMTLTEQDAFFQKELKAIQKYFPDIIILSAVVHRDEVFHPIDEDMRALFPEGKITPHMHITTVLKLAKRQTSFWISFLFKRFAPTCTCFQLQQKSL